MYYLNKKNYKKTIKQKQIKMEQIEKKNLNENCVLL